MCIWCKNLAIADLIKVNYEGIRHRVEKLNGKLIFFMIG